MPNFRPLDDPAFLQLCGYVDALNRYLDAIRGNLVVSFDVNGFELVDAPFDAAQAVRQAEPDMADYGLDISGRSQPEFHQDIDAAVQRTPPAWATGRIADHLHAKLYDGLRGQLKACIDLEDERSTFFGYSYPSPRVVRYLTFGFDYLSWEGERNRCILISCGDMD